MVAVSRTVCAAISAPAILLFACAGAGAAFAFTNDECLECHSEPTIQTLRDSTTVSLYVGAAEFESSVHAGMACSDCHADIVDFPHPDTVAKVDCSTCHGEAQAEYATSVHGQAAARGVAEAPGCADCHGTHAILPASNPASTVHPQRVVGTCAQCHAEPEVVRRTGVTHGPIDAYVQSVHGKALLVEGHPNAPTCSTCHPAHTMLSRTDPNSTINRMNVPGTCGMCHSDIAEVYLESIHGTAAMRGITDSPVCTDCHGEHDIKGPEDPESSVFPANIAKTTCTRCHESLILSRRYGFDTNRIATYRETYHGLATEKGALNVANCASCHGIHNIFPSSDPRSTVNPANLTKTCGGCHPNATEAFAHIQVHPEISGEAPPMAPRRPRDIARSIYIWILVIAVGGMVIHNAIIWVFHVVEKRRRELKEPRVGRFRRFEAAEHLILLISFFTLVFTGFALKFPDAGWANLTERLGLSEGMRSLVHRIAAVAMMAVSISHLGYLLFTRSGRKELGELRPTLADVRDFIANMRYHLRLRSERPVFPHFDYTEKFEYLALIWGTVVMVATGLVLWFPTYFTRWLPAWGVEVSEVVHYYEAWLAFLAILLWHLFYVIFHPESHPMNLTWLDGKTPVEKAIHKHGQLEEGQKIEVRPEAEGGRGPGTGRWS